MRAAAFVAGFTAVFVAMGAGASTVGRFIGDHLTTTAALISLNGMGGWSRAFAQQKLTQFELLAFEPFGNVTIVRVTDIHGQLKPVYFREPSINLGVGPMQGLPPHIVGGEFLK